MGQMVQNSKLGPITFTPTGEGAAMPILWGDGRADTGGHGRP